MYIQISSTAVEREYDTKFLGVYIDAQLTGKNILNIHAVSYENVLVFS